MRIGVTRSGSVIGLLAAGCAGSERAPAPAAAPAPAVGSVSPPPVASSAAVTPAAAQPAEAPPAAEVAEIANRNAAEGSTVKTIACGEQRCRAGKEICKLETEPYRWVCVPSGTAAESFYACDDASDCAAPLTCCRSFASAAEVYACEKPNADCAALVCSEPDGTKCPPGLRCNDGYCGADSRATCGGGKQCPKESAYCAWSSAPACVDAAAAEKAAGAMQEEASAISGVYQCTKPSDCGSHHCCTSMSYGEKLTNCFHQCDGANSMLLCARDADCRDRAQACYVREPMTGRTVRFGPFERQELPRVTALPRAGAVSNATRSCQAEAKLR